ncbi:hypothetical protein DDZ13_12700 [Coraliomargarita sinensis]|uniref:Uncharacterized protein n=1 Tax=Coraliomargarita sinensis TaxID=2174842 RepID=A0A317ZHP1_9BACT|nr:hypothetical protein DDZ13_12700 [Coraliomargarita sinensis]
MFTLFLVLPITLIAQTTERGEASHLKGINYLYMNVDTSLAPRITSAERLDISDIVELQLRRADINLRPYVMNAPQTNVPLVEVSIKVAQSRSVDNYELTLKVFDYVTIDRNKQRTIATIYEMQRESVPTPDDLSSLKSKLRELMSDFVTAFEKQNP